MGVMVVGVLEGEMVGVVVGGMVGVLETDCRLVIDSTVDTGSSVVRDSIVVGGMVGVLESDCCLVIDSTVGTDSSVVRAIDFIVEGGVVFTVG